MSKGSNISVLGFLILLHQIHSPSFFVHHYILQVDHYRLHQQTLILWLFVGVRPMESTTGDWKAGREWGQGTDSPNPLLPAVVRVATVSEVAFSYSFISAGSLTSLFLAPSGSRVIKAGPGFCTIFLVLLWWHK